MIIKASDEALHMGERGAPDGGAHRSTWGSAALHMGEQEHGIHGSPMDFHGWRPAIAVALGAPAPPSQAAVTELHLKRPRRSVDPDCRRRLQTTARR